MNYWRVEMSQGFWGYSEENASSSDRTLFTHNYWGRVKLCCQTTEYQRLCLLSSGTDFVIHQHRCFFLTLLLKVHRYKTQLWFCNQHTFFYFYFKPVSTLSIYNHCKTIYPKKKNRKRLSVQTNHKQSYLFNIFFVRQHQINMLDNGFRNLKSKFILWKYFHFIV